MTDNAIPIHGAQQRNDAVIKRMKQKEMHRHFNQAMSHLQDGLKIAVDFGIHDATVDKISRIILYAPEEKK